MLSTAAAAEVAITIVEDKALIAPSELGSRQTGLKCQAEVRSTCGFDQLLSSMQSGATRGAINRMPSTSPSWWRWRVREQIRQYESCDITY